MHNIVYFNQVATFIKRICDFIEDVFPENVKPLQNDLKFEDGHEKNCLSVCLLNILVFFLW